MWAPLGFLSFLQDVNGNGGLSLAEIDKASAPTIHAANADYSQA